MFLISSCQSNNSLILACSDSSSTNFGSKFLLFPILKGSTISQIILYRGVSPKLPETPFKECAASKAFATSLALTASASAVKSGS